MARTVSLVLLLAHPILSQTEGSAERIPVWGIFEKSISNPASYDNPFTGVDLTGTFAGPDGSKVSFPGFYSGDGKGGQTGKVWKLRFMPDKPGKWRYAYSWSDNTKGGSGTFIAFKSDLPGPLKPGKQKVSTWYGVNCGPLIPFYVAGPGYMQVDDPRMDEYLDYVKQTLRANGIALVLQNFVWLECQENGNCSPSKKRFSIRNWHRIDRFLEKLSSRNLGANIMLYTDDAGRPRFSGRSETEKLLFKYTIARLAPYALITFDSGIDILEYRQADWSTFFAASFLDLDPWDHAVGSRHSGGSGKFECSKCTYDARGHIHPAWKQILNTMKTTDRPVFYTDRWREDFRRGNFSSDSLRAVMWHCAMAGGAGFMVGGKYGELRLENYRGDLDNPAQFRAFSGFWHKRLRTWDTFSIHTKLRGGALMAGNQKDEFVLYFPKNTERAALDLSKVKRSLNVTWLNPRTGEYFKSSPAEGGEEVEFTPPDLHDWAVLLSARKQNRNLPELPVEAPEIVFATNRGRARRVYVTFNKPVTRRTGEDPENYRITPQVEIRSAACEHGSRTVVLKTARLSRSRTYTLHVHNIEGLGRTGGRIREGTQVTFSYEKRTRKGLVALYTFSEGKGTAVHDSSGSGDPLDLRVRDKKAIKWVPGGLRVVASAIIGSGKPAAKILEACTKTDQVTIECWLTPARLDLRGPSRIVTLSANPSVRNFTLGQEGREYDVRFRTTKTDRQGIPSLSTASNPVAARLTHVVYTRNSSGTVRIYVNGQERARSARKGSLSNWNAGYRLAVANELTGDRPWYGTFHLVAIYNRALDYQAVKRNFFSGADPFLPSHSESNIKE